MFLLAFRSNALTDKDRPSLRPDFPEHVLRFWVLLTNQCTQASSAVWERRLWDKQHNMIERWDEVLWEAHFISQYSLSTLSPQCFTIHLLIVDYWLYLPLRSIDWPFFTLIYLALTVLGFQSAFTVQVLSPLDRGWLALAPLSLVSIIVT